MINSNNGLLKEIDATIDQLVKNAEVLKNISSKKEYVEEVDALEKTQESLLAHLIHMDELLKTKRCIPLSGESTLLAKSVHNKLGRSGYLNTVIKKKEKFEEKKEKQKIPSRAKKPKIHKRRTFAGKVI
ncbi:hypothetical protein COB11_08215 [Candidatus Aerophobetes bacterium]|uniref:Uncharacterized protein n=1 Tax=Aerophobetes bacterium TaxID=2030807 RepID=A0A2A4YA66_UNCAE|nr:MAG: hypothetical protein COB11_08215 [Candidatus Aerophobetes bacterium]